jgi:dihydrofolate synthase/folylpolyglutamate synthase
VLYGGLDKSAESVIKNVAAERGSKFYGIDYTEIKNLNSSLDGTSFDYKSHKDIHINLLGLYQPRNAALVLRAIDILREGGLNITEAAVKDGLNAARWPARFEIISHDPLVIFDGAHNPQGIESAVESIKHYFGKSKVLVFTGVLRDKDHRYIAGKLGEIAERAFTITPENPRALSAEDYAAELSEVGVFAKPYPSIEEALSEAKKVAKDENKALVCLGSLYTYQDVIKYV